jgi:site-specific recombinase XerD
MNHPTLPLSDDQFNELTALLAAAMPTLRGLSPDQLELVYKQAVSQKLAADMQTELATASIDYFHEKHTFLDHALTSPHTRRSYQKGLERLETYASSVNTPPLKLTEAQVDDWIYELSRESSPATTRTRTAAASAFFSWLSRRHKALSNPFRGSKARPKRSNIKPIIIPSPDLLHTILIHARPIDKAIIATLAFRGFRAGALTGLTLAGTHFSTASKGKDIRGTIPLSLLHIIKAAGLSTRRPFARWSHLAIESRVNRLMRRLYTAGIIPDRYSAHDFRHFFAVQEYQKDHDIRRVSRLLFHENIAITDRYLCALGLSDSDSNDLNS